MIRIASARASSFSLAALLSVGLLSSAHAASITWGSGQALTGDTDVKNNGTAVDAISIGGANLVNNVTFNGVQPAGSSLSDGTITVSFGNSYGNYTAPFPTTPPSSTAYSNLVNTGAFGQNSNVGSFNLVTLGGTTQLNIGDVYQVQAFSYYSGDSVATTSYTTDAMTADQGIAGATVTNSTGGYAVGTFTADAATQSFNYFLTVPFTGHNFLNAVVLRDLTPTGTPEPASLGLLCVGAGILMKRRCRA